jgi:predicted Fe-S protein YdhL (DUF1289 family)
MSVSSPCIQVCLMDRHDLCVGCRRSRDEIARWLAMDDDEKRAVLARIEQRKQVPERDAEVQVS